MKQFFIQRRVISRKIFLQMNASRGREHKVGIEEVGSPFSKFVNLVLYSLWVFPSGLSTSTGESPSLLMCMKWIVSFWLRLKIQQHICCKKKGFKLVKKHQLKLKHLDFTSQFQLKGFAFYTGSFLKLLIPNPLTFGFGMIFSSIKQ